MSSPEIILVGGAPGSGKSEICRAFVKANHPDGVRHLSVGDLKRDILAGNVSSAYAERLRQKKHAGRKTGAVSSEAIIGMIEEFVMTRPEGLILLDGFPRYMDRVDPFKQSMRQLSANILALAVVEIDEDIGAQRLSSRIDRPDQMIKDYSERLADHQENVMPTLEALAQEYPTYRLDGTLAPESNTVELRAIYSRHSLNEQFEG